VPLLCVAGAPAGAALVFVRIATFSVAFYQASRAIPAVLQARLLAVDIKANTGGARDFFGLNFYDPLIQQSHPIPSRPSCPPRQSGPAWRVGVAAGPWYPHSIMSV